MCLQKHAKSTLTYNLNKIYLNFGFLELYYKTANKLKDLINLFFLFRFLYYYYFYRNCIRVPFSS